MSAYLSEAMKLTTLANGPQVGQQLHFLRCEKLKLRREGCKRLYKKSSHAVAERPRDALCLSVVSFNSVIHRAQSFIIVISASGLPLRTTKCRSVVFDATLRLLVIHFVVVSRQKQTPPLISDQCHQLASLSRLSVLHLVLTARDGARYWLRIAISAYPMHLHSTPPLGVFPSEYCHDFRYGKTKMV